MDRGQLRKLTEPTVLPSGKRIPGLKLENPRQLALMHALVRFAHIAAGSTFTTAELYPFVLAALQISADQYSLASLRYDLSKLRAKALVEKLPKSRRYRLCPQGYSICLVFLKLFERIYAPLTAGLLQPVSADVHLQRHRLPDLPRTPRPNHSRQQPAFAARPELGDHARWHCCHQCRQWRFVLGMPSQSQWVGDQYAG